MVIKTKFKYQNIYPKWHSIISVIHFLFPLLHYIYYYKIYICQVIASLSIPMNSNFQQSNLFAFTYPNKKKKKNKKKQKKKRENETKTLKTWTQIAK